MLPDRVSNPGPLTYESGALPIALRGPTQTDVLKTVDATNQVETLLQTLMALSGVKKNARTQTEGLTLRELQGFR